MNTGKTLFAQLMDFLPWKRFHRINARRNGDHGVRYFSAAEQQGRVRIKMPTVSRLANQGVVTCSVRTLVHTLRNWSPRTSERLRFRHQDFD